MNKINVVNPNDKNWCRHSYLLWFGQCGATFLLVYSNDLDSALEDAADWLAENAPGHLVSHEEHTELCKEACDDAGLTWPPPSDWCNDNAYVSAIESAEADLTYTESGYLTSYEWGIVREDPTPREVSDFYHCRA